MLFSFTSLRAEGLCDVLDERRLRVRRSVSDVDDHWDPADGDDGLLVSSNPSDRSLIRSGWTSMVVARAF